MKWNGEQLYLLRLLIARLKGRRNVPLYVEHILFCSSETTVPPPHSQESWDWDRIEETTKMSEEWFSKYNILISTHTHTPG